MELPVICKTIYDNTKSAYIKYYKCNKCNYTCSNLWNLKKHTVEHISIKQKNKLPFYCKICDSISISEQYYETHLTSDSHIEKTIGKDIKKYIDSRMEKLTQRINELLSSNSL